MDFQKKIINLEEKMGNKAAIITLYHESINYGGLLQAYALQKIISKYVYDTEVLSYNWHPTSKKNTSKMKRFFCRFFKCFNLKTLIVYFKNKKLKKVLSSRRKLIDKFRDSIPHSLDSYNSETVSLCVNDYDIFVTGSDQVWNFKWYSPTFFLDFVPKTKIKFSYAASISMEKLSDSQKEILANHLENYKGVSVREQEDVALLQGIANAKWVLDPTLLLSREKWDELHPNRLVHEKYIYCYFLGFSCEQRKIVTDFAIKKGLKIVFVPYIHGLYKKCDKNFGDIHLYDVGPAEFISLIKHAEYVFTDSFHAMVFSGIYKKQYFVFQRENHLEMASRIYSLCELYETPERFCDTKDKCTLEYIENLSDIDYERPLQKLSEMRDASVNYLKENLKK